mgnify:CR=1 FL=1
MEFMNVIAEFSYPSAIIAAYVAITLVKHYTKIDSKYYMIIGIVTGMAVVALEEVISSPITIQKLVAGALSGIVATVCYETINKILKTKK